MSVRDPHDSLRATTELTEGGGSVSQSGPRDHVSQHGSVRNTSSLTEGDGAFSQGVPRGPGRLANSSRMTTVLAQRGSTSDDAVSPQMRLNRRVPSKGAHSPGDDGYHAHHRYDDEVEVIKVHRALNAPGDVASAPQRSNNNLQNGRGPYGNGWQQRLPNNYHGKMAALGRMENANELKKKRSKRPADSLLERGAAKPPDRAGNVGGWAKTSTGGPKSARQRMLELDLEKGEALRREKQMARNAEGIFDDEAHSDESEESTSVEEEERRLNKCCKDHFCNPCHGGCQVICGIFIFCVMVGIVVVIVVLSNRQRDEIGVQELNNQAE